MKIIKIGLIIMSLSLLTACEAWEAYFGCRIGGGDWPTCNDYLIP